MKKRKMILILSASICLSLIISITLLYLLAPKKQRIPMQLPEDATEIKYLAKRYEGVGYEEYLRFNIPIEKCISVAENILKNHSNKDIEIASTNIENYNLLQHGGPSWFKDNIISNGKILCFKNSKPGDPVIFVDTKKGIIYYLLTD